MREYIRPNENFIMNPDNVLLDTVIVCVDELLEGETLGFKVGGHKIDHEHSDCLCKVVMQILDRDNTRLVFFVRMDGTSALYDPWGIDEGRAARLDQHKGAEQWRFTKVSKKVFEQYLSFLKTHNPAHLHNAQRDAR